MDEIYSVAIIFAYDIGGAAVAWGLIFAASRAYWQKHHWLLAAAFASSPGGGLARRFSAVTQSEMVLVTGAVVLVGFLLFCSVLWAAERRLPKLAEIGAYAIMCVAREAGNALYHSQQ